MSGDQAPLAVLDNGPREYAEILTGLALLNQSFVSLQGDLAELRAGMTQTLSELQRRNELTQEGLDGLRIGYTSRCGVLDRVVEDVKDIDQRVKVLERLAPTIRAVMWIGAALGLSVMALIWSLITGQAQVVFIR